MRLKKKHKTTGSHDLFRARLDQIINMKHELVLLADKVDWDWIDGEIAPLYSENGRPGIETRFMIGLLLLSTFMGCPTRGLSSGAGFAIRISSSFTGEEFFQHAFPHERSDLSHWRKRLNDKLQLLLAESLRVAARYTARISSASRSTPRCSRRRSPFRPMPAAACGHQGLNRLARRHGVGLRQSYARVAKAAAMMASHTLTPNSSGGISNSCHPA